MKITRQAFAELPLGERPVGRHKNSSFEIDHQRRAALTRVYLRMACPDIDKNNRTKLAASILALIDNRESATPQRGITDAQVVEMVWRNMQCINYRCPMLLFGNQLAEEINEFFKGDQ